MTLRILYLVLLELKICLVIFFFVNYFRWKSQKAQNISCSDLYRDLDININNTFLSYSNNKKR